MDLVEEETFSESEVGGKKLNKVEWHLRGKVKSTDEDEDVEDDDVQDDYDEHRDEQATAFGVTGEAEADLVNAFLPPRH